MGKVPSVTKLRLSLRRQDYIMLGLGAAVAIACFGLMRLMYNSQTPLRPESNQVTSPWIPPTVHKWDKQINAMAAKYKVDPNLIAIIITLESGGYQKATSEADAKGLMQITPPTAKDIAAKFLKKPV